MDYREGPMDQTMPFLAGVAVGAGLMYLLDPDRGSRRRSLMRDQVAHFTHSIDDVVDATTDDLTNRARGFAAEAGAMFKHEQVDDAVLAERVRARLGRACSHPGAIEVAAEQGKVTLRGPILKREVNQVISAVSSVRGVAYVENELQVHERADDVPGLQGKARPRGMQPDIMQENWAPATRLLVGSAGMALAAYGAGRRDIPGMAIAGVGLLLLARGATNMDTGRLVGVGAGRRAIDLHKTITVNAPVARVFDFWQHFDNFPRFMSHLKEVRDLGNGRSHWSAVGPAGTPVEWDAMITKFEQNKAIAWKSVPGSIVGNAGIVQFEETPTGDTRITIHLSYNPPAGALGHAVASLFGSDPKHAMDADMVRFKSLIEEGKTTAHDETVMSTEITGEMTAEGSTQTPNVH